MGYLALNLDGPIDTAMDTLTRNGVDFMGPVDRGYERSVYFKDPRGCTRPASNDRTWIPSKELNSLASRLAQLTIESVCCGVSDFSRCLELRLSDASSKSVALVGIA
jgi:hypothetical protein